MLGSLREIPNQVLAVEGRDINAFKIHIHALKLEVLSRKNLNRESASPLHRNPSQAALREHRGNEIIASIREGLTLKHEINRDISSVQSVQGQRQSYKKWFAREKFPMRFRDWNPDVKVALRSGLNIRYSSRTNEIHCPELRLSSRGLVASKARISGGGLNFSGSGSSLSSSGSSSGSRSASSGARMSSSGSRSSSSSGSASTRKK